MTLETDDELQQALERYMALPYRIVLYPDPDEGGYAVSIPDLSGCLSQGETVEEAMAMIREAERAWLRTALEHDEPIPEPREDGEYSGTFNVRIASSLHRDLARCAEEDGVSLNQFVNIALARAVGRREAEKSAAQRP